MLSQTIDFIRGNQVFVQGGLRPWCLRLREGRIVEGAPALQPGPDERVLEAGELWLLPGMIDSQVHFREPGLEHKEDLETGSRAAIAGGVTSFLEMPNTRPATIDRAALEDKLERAADHAWADHGFFIGATPDNAPELPALERLPGVPGIKIFMGSSTGTLLVDEDEALRAVLASGTRRVAVHAEDEPRLRRLKKELGPQVDHARWHPRLRDPECARLAVERLVGLAREAGRPIHVLHTNSLQEMELLAPYAGDDRVTVETTPQHLLLTAPECYDRLGSHAQMNPPLREKEHAAALWRALEAGVIDVIGSDHAPHTLEEKKRPYPQSPSGMPGVETVLPVLLDCVQQGRLKLADLVRLYCETPARLYGIRSKARLEPGHDADLVLVDPKERWTVRGVELQSRAGWTPWEGHELQGRVHSTLLRGRVVYRQGRFASESSGRALAFDF